MWDRQQHSLSRNNRKYFAEYLTWQTFCQCPALFTNGSDMWKVVSTLVLFFSHIRILNNHVHCACMCLSKHFLHVCRNYGFQSVSLTTIYPLVGKQVHLLDFFVSPQALGHSPPLCGVQQMPLSYSPQMISPAAVPAGACISSSDNLEAQLSLQKCVVKKN